MGINQKELARILGTTQATISRALSDHPEVSESLRVKVKELADRLGYQPNYSATALSSRRTRTISALISVAPHLLLSQIHSHWFSCLQEAVHQKGYRFRIDPIDNFQKVEGESIADGFIVFGDLAGDTIRSTDRKGRPIVYTDCTSLSGRPNSVSIDSACGVGEAVSHLADLGHREIAFFGLIPGIVDNSFERHQGYLKQLGRLGLPVKDEYTVCQEGWPHEVEQVLVYRDKLETLLDAGVTAIIASSDIAAAGVIRMVRKAGRRVPEDVSVVGFDDTLLARAFDPPFTTVRQDVGRASVLAVEMLAKQISEGIESPPAIVPSMLVVRESTGMANNKR